MANKSFVVQYLIKMRDKYSSSANKAAKATAGLSSKLTGATRKMRRFGDESKKTSRKTTAAFANMKSSMLGFAGGVSVVLGIRKFITEGAKFQDAIADLAAITGSEGEALKTLSNETLRLAKNSKIAQSEVAAAFKIVASAKSELLKDPRGLSRVTEQVLLLKNATGLELAEAATVVTEAMNQFGASADQAARFVNVLAAGSKVGASEVAQTGAAIVKAGVAAKLAGLSFEETNAALQVLAKNGLKADIAGTGLQTVLLKLESQNNRKIKPSIVGLVNAFKNLNDANLSAKEQSKLFGLEGIKVGNILASNAPLIKQWTREITGSNEAQKQADKRLATFNAKLRGIGITINESLIKAFIRLEPTLSKAADDFTAFVGGIDDSSIRAFADTAEILVGALKHVAFFAGEALGILKGIGEIIGQVTAAIVSLDFSRFDLENVFRIGGGETGGAAALAQQSVGVDVGVNVGLAPGLEQTTAPAVTQSGARRSDVGMALAGG
ncbi:MAG: phage tail tape measure protein [candidate division Zixibacteria bacterium]|nr:phage tail tape measure protein [candidate division Zixibacteria bacterium]